MYKQGLGFLTSETARFRPSQHVRRARDASRSRIILFANLGHALDHYIMLIYPTTILALEKAFPEVSYGTLLQLSLGAFVLIGLGSLPSGWLGDKWSRRGMMIIFFFGAGVACLATAATNSFFALAVGPRRDRPRRLDLPSSRRADDGRERLARAAGRVIGLNGVFGNLAIASAPFITGAVTDLFGWRLAFILPGIAALAIGAAFVADGAGCGGARRRARAPCEGIFALYCVSRLRHPVFLHLCGGAHLQRRERHLPQVVRGAACRMSCIRRPRRAP